jgi:4-amino-4-deoxy-L-arabinose transferase-like glycosyltransferase
LCAVWVTVVVGFFTLSSGKLGTYVLPAFPPLAVLTGRHLARLASGEATEPERRLTRAGLWIVAGMLGIAPFVIAVAGWRIYDGAHFRTSLLALALVPAGVGLAWMIRRAALAAAAATVAAGAVAGILLFHGVAAPRIGETHSGRALARVLAAHPDAPVAVYQVRPASIVFYLGRPVLAVNRARRLARLAEDHPLAFVVTSPRHVPGLEATGRWYPWLRGPRRVLYGTQLPSLTPAEIDADNAAR